MTEVDETLCLHGSINQLGKSLSRKYYTGLAPIVRINMTKRFSSVAAQWSGSLGTNWFEEVGAVLKEGFLVEEVEVDIVKCRLWWIGDPRALYTRSVSTRWLVLAMILITRCIQNW